MIRGSIVALITPMDADGAVDICDTFLHGETGAAEQVYNALLQQAATSGEQNADRVGIAPCIVPLTLTYLAQSG